MVSSKEAPKTRAGPCPPLVSFEQCLWFCGYSVVSLYFPIDSGSDREELECPQPLQEKNFFKSLKALSQLDFHERTTLVEHIAEN
eukprot:399992-Amphidinium_carterae.2